jgi:hypothetical protein
MLVIGTCFCISGIVDVEMFLNLVAEAGEMFR